MSKTVLNTCLVSGPSVFTSMLLLPRLGMLGALHDYIICKDGAVCGSCSGKATELQTHLSRY